MLRLVSQPVLRQDFDTQNELDALRQARFVDDLNSSLPRKKIASVPGPECEPITGPTG